MRTIIAVIPCRYASTRFPGKPLAKICGVSMIERIVRRITDTPCISDVIVATDDERIKNAVSSFGGKVMDTSLHHTCGTERVAEVARVLKLNESDIVVNIQGDQPLIHPESIEKVIEPLLEDPNLGMSTLAFPIVDEREITDPKDCKVVFDQNGYALYFSRASIPWQRDPEEGDVTYYKHLGIYAYTHSFLQKFITWPMGRLEQIEKLEQLRTLEYGYRIGVRVFEHDSLEVDLPVDIERIEKKINEKQSRII